MSLWKLIWETLQLDTVSLIPNSSWEPLKPNLLLELKRKRRHAGAQFIHLLRYPLRLLRAWRNSGPPIDECDRDLVHFVAFSKNQADSLRPIYEHLVPRVASRLWADRPFRQQIAWAHLWSLPFVPAVLWRWLTSHGYRRESFRWSIDDYLLNYGLHFVWRRWLRKIRPTAVVVGNDHVQLSCVFAAAAKAEGIPTFYAQHACVTDKFPPLATDYALLDGKDAAIKYAGAGASDTRAFLVGIGKFDAWSEKVRTSDKLERLGVCFSMGDLLERSLGLLRAVSDELGSRVTVTVRPHPRMQGDTLAALRRLADELGMDWSDAADESSFEFLCSQDVIVCGVSAIALEAALVNVVPINFQLNLDHTDWYGFVESGFFRSTADLDELSSWLREASENGTESARGKTPRYCATVGTQWDGRAAELAARVIELQLADGRVEELGLRRTDVGSLCVYSP